MLPLSLTSLRIACRSDRNGKYLSCVHDKSKGGNHIEASAERVPGTARTRFWVESYDEEKGHVHIRCGYNNKYWKPQQIGDGHWIIGTADKHEELTLFQPVEYKDNSIRFYHPDLKKYVCVADETETYLQLKDQEHMERGGDDNHRPDTFTVIGLNYHKDLPQHVLFKGDNGLYLQPQFYMPSGVGGPSPDGILRIMQQLPRYLQFSQKDKSERSEERSTLHTVTTNHDGLIRIRCADNGKFWRHRSDFLVADSRENNFNDLNTVFKVHTVDGFTVLENMGNNKFCKRLTSYGDDTNWFTRIYKENCLSAATDVKAAKEAKLVVEEPILEGGREISNIRFHLDEARRYTLGPFEKGNNIHGGTKGGSALAEFSREDRWESKWETSVTVHTSEELNTSFGLDAEIELPHVEGGKIALGFKWDHIKKTDTTRYHAEANSVSVVQERKIAQRFATPPNKVKKAILYEIQQCCDVPFSYTLTDSLMLDKEVELPPVTHDDGIYTFSTLDFRIDIVDVVEPQK